MADKTVPFLPYGRQLLDESDIASVVDVLHSDFLTSGPKLEQFEAALRDHSQGANCVVCSSGTAGLHLALVALGVGPGDTVIVPTLTFLATANAVRFLGANVVFADVDGDTGLLTSETLSQAIQRADGPVKAVLAVHLNGQCCHMESLSEITRSIGAFLIEDACHALGTTVGGHPVGACELSDACVFSFHPVKTISAGEGGAITTRNQELADRMRCFRNHGMTRNAEAFRNTDLAFDEDGQTNAWYYEMHDLGFNYRLSELHAALGLSQFNKLPAFTERRRNLRDAYVEALRPLAPKVIPLPTMAEQMPTWHLMVVLIDFEACNMSRNTLMAALHAQGVGSQVHYLPVHLQPYYQDLAPQPNLPGSEHYYKRALSLPLFPAMHEDDVSRVVRALTAGL